MYCSECGAKLKEGGRFCQSCGRPTYQSASGGSGYYSGVGPGGFGLKDISENKAMAVLAYLGFLVIVPILAAKTSPYARFHANQGLILFICECIAGVAFGIITSLFYRIFWGMGFFMSVLLSVVYLGFIIFAIAGIINAINGQARELPIIGSIRIIV